MALVKGRRYYQQSFRVGDKVKTRYFGVNGVFFALLDRERAEEKRQKREQRIAWEQGETQRYQEFKQRTAAINHLVVTALHGLGFIRIDRGAWRRSRVETLPRRYPDRGDTEIRERMRELIRDYCRDVPGAIVELHDLSRRYPREFATEAEMNLSEMAVQGLINHELPKHDAYSNKLRVDWRARIGVMARELAGDNASPARRLCAALVALADTEFFLLTVQAASTGVRTEALLSARRRTYAHQRYQAALRTFSQIELAEKRSRRMVHIVTMAEA
jgi:hypothetical protein